MQKYGTFILFLVLVTIWSMFFTTIKFFLWGDLKDTLHVSLQTISWYLSLGWVIAYLVWGALATTFLKKYLLFALSFLTLIFVLCGYIFVLDTEVYFWFTVIFIGMFYGAWAVVKNIIISIEIKKTWLPDTSVNAYVSIVFIVSLIIWSILGWLLFENLWKNWYLVIIFMLCLSSVLSLKLDYDNISLRSLLTNWVKPYYFERKEKFKDSMRDYLPELKYISHNYTLLIVSSSFMWAISTLTSQKAIEYSVANFWKWESEAAMILLYSAVWAIIWSVVSMKMWWKRWFWFIVTNIIFALLVWFLPMFSYNYEIVATFAFLIWVFFGISSNLLDAYYFKILWDEDKKEYWASTYGLILSLILSFMMFIANYIEKTFSYDVLMMILWIILFIISYLIYRKFFVCENKKMYNS
jgi:MFS family permease